MTKSNWPEAIAGILIPPACREEVLGDLYERNATPRQYVRDALRTVPLVIVSRIRRTCVPGPFAMHAAVFYVSFFAAAWLEAPVLLYEHWGLWRFAIPCAVWLLALLLEDAYSAGHSLLRGPMFAIAVVFISQAALGAIASGLALPFSIVLPGGLLGLALTLAIRLLFQPPSQSQRGPI